MQFEDLFGDKRIETSAGVALYMLAEEVRSNFPNAEALSEFGNGLTIAQEMDALKEDLSRLEDGWSPTPEDLKNAPEIQKWGVLDTGDPLPRIWGEVVGASLVGAAVAEGKRMITLHVLAKDKDTTWVRDRRGFYRLEEPF
jgi:hypothetical protein